MSGTTTGGTMLGLEDVKARTPPLVLIAEDHDDTLELMALSARMRGWEVHTAQSAEQMLDRINGRHCSGAKCYDAIISDVQFFGNGEGQFQETGITAGHQIRKTYPNVPILYVTGFASALIRQQARKQGADVIPKPFDMRMVLDRAEAMMELAGTQNSYAGDERRWRSINHTDFHRRVTDQPLRMPSVVHDAIQASKGGHKL